MRVSVVKADKQWQSPAKQDPICGIAIFLIYMQLSIKSLKRQYYIIHLSVVQLLSFFSPFCSVFFFYYSNLLLFKSNFLHLFQIGDCLSLCSFFFLMHVQSKLQIKLLNSAKSLTFSFYSPVHVFAIDDLAPPSW